MYHENGTRCAAWEYEDLGSYLWSEGLDQASSLLSNNARVEICRKPCKKARDIEAIQ